MNIDEKINNIIGNANIDDALKNNPGFRSKILDLVYDTNRNYSLQVSENGKIVTVVVSEVVDLKEGTRRQEFLEAYVLADGEVVVENTSGKIINNMDKDKAMLEAHKSQAVFDNDGFALKYKDYLDYIENVSPNVNIINQLVYYGAPNLDPRYNGVELPKLSTKPVLRTWTRNRNNPGFIYESIGTVVEEHSKAIEYNQCVRPLNTNSCGDITEMQPYYDVELARYNRSLKTWEVTDKTYKEMSFEALKQMYENYQYDFTNVYGPANIRNK